MLKDQSERLDLIRIRTGELEEINKELVSQIEERKRVEADLLQKMQHLAILSHSTQAITASLNINEVWKEMVAFVSSVAPSDFISVDMLDENGRVSERLVLKEGQGEGFLNPNLDAGITFWIVKTRESIIVDTIEDGGLLLPGQSPGQPQQSSRFIKLDGFKSFAALPLLAKDKLLGVLNLYSLNHFAYQDRAHLLTAFVNQAALAIDGALLFKEIQNQAAHTGSLVRIANRLNAQLDLDSVLCAVCEETARAMKVPAAGVSLFNPVTGRFMHAAVYGLPANEPRVEDIQDLSYDELTSKTRLAAGSLGNGEFTKIAEDLGIYTVGRAVMVRDGLVIGSINLYSFDKEQKFSTQDGELLKGLADQSAQAIVNARLIEKTVEQAEQVSLIINTVPDGVILLGPNFEIQMANPAARKFLCQLSDVKVGEKLEILGGYSIKKYLTSKEGAPCHHIETANRYFDVIARPIDNGKIQSWVLVLREITLEKESQKRIQQQERLAAVGQLAAGIAHDFNNLMSVIVLYGQLLLKEGNLLSRSRERLVTIVRQAKQATELIGQILEFSRSSDIERKPLKLTPILKEQVKLLERTLPENIKINFKTKVDEFEINGDPTRLQQMVMNLVVNARDAMLEGGTLEISISHAAVDEEIDCVICGKVKPDSPCWIRLDVSDTGTGIDTRVLSHIFEPFFTTKEAGKGSGLGLAQVYAIVQQHEGHLIVKTESNKGTTFSVLFPPIKIPQSVIVAEDQGKLAIGKGETILLVEDNPTTRDAIREGLEMLNYQVLEAQNGREALEILDSESERVKMILSDLVMPEMGGYALTRALEARKISIPLVILTGHPLDDRIRELESAGVTAWFKKPPDLEKLATAIASVLKNQNSVE